MPRGIPNKPKEKANEAQAETQEKVVDVLKQEATVAVAQPVVTPPHYSTVVTSKVLEPLNGGQSYFEAPDGTVIIGDSTRDQIWYRQGNHGKGMWINKRR